MIPNLSAIMAGIIVALSLSNAFFINRWSAANERYANLESAVEQAQKQAEEDALHERAERERVVADVSQSWQRALDYARGHPLVRVLPRDCGVSQAGTLPAAGLKPDAPTAQQGLGAAVDVSECEGRLNNAVLDAAQVMHLQDFIARQYEASK